MMRRIYISCDLMDKMTIFCLAAVAFPRKRQYLLSKLMLKVEQMLQQFTLLGKSDRPEVKH